MTTKTMVFLFGVCVGIATPLIAKAVKLFGVHALAGGMVAYEAACDAVESSKEAISVSATRIQRVLKHERVHESEIEPESPV